MSVNEGDGGATPDADEAFALAESLWAAQAALRRAARRFARRPLELSALNGSQLELVRYTKRQEGCSITEAARDLGLAPNTVSTLVRQLADADILVRHTDRADRRNARLALSSRIRRQVEDWEDRRIVAIGEAIAGMGRADHAILAAAVPLLLDLAAHLDRNQPGD